MRTLLLLLTLGVTLHAAEYFTGRQGSDTADGRSEKTAFASIAAGFKKLQPGDTLTILPGAYFEAVSSSVCGTLEAPITIRAQRPGTVLLRGDVDAPLFHPVEGAPHLYVTDFKQRVEGVIERSGLRLYEPLPTVEEVEQTHASYYQDETAGRLYVHTSDSAPPDTRALTISVTNGFGLLLTPPPKTPTVHDLVIEGLSFTGYNSREYPTGPGSRNRWGFGLVNGERVTVRRCSAYLNSGGFYLLMPVHCLVEDCHALANFSRFQTIGNNLVGWGPSDTTFRHNTVEAFWEGAPLSASDITFYGGRGTADERPCRGVMEDNLAINGGVMIKGEASGSEQHGNVAVGHASYFYQKEDATNLLLTDDRSEKARLLYADPVHHDFRRQGEGSDVFYVSPSGDDAANGTSLKTAWHTLAHAAAAAGAGQTVYVQAGDYRESLMPEHDGTAGKPIRFVRYGHDRVALAAIGLHGRAHLVVDGFIVQNELSATDCTDITIENTIATGWAVIARVKSLTFTHNLLSQAAGLALESVAQATLAANLFDRCHPALNVDAVSLAGLWSNANAFSPDAAAPALIVTSANHYKSLAAWQHETALDPDSLETSVVFPNDEAGPSQFALREDSPLIGRGPEGSAIGPFQRFRIARPLPIENLALHEASDTTATLEWWTPTQLAECALEWGEGKAGAQKVVSPSGAFHTVSLTGLKSDSIYHYRVTSAKPGEAIVFAPWLLATPPLASLALAPEQSFETAGAASAPRTFHVAVTGDDRHSGLSPEQAWRTINHAADLVRAGDTVLIHAGTYEESVTVRSTGDEGAPITFRAAPGETVWMDGHQRFRCTAFNLLDKHYIVIDGLRFHHFRYAAGQNVIQISGGSHITIQRCLHDGREAEGYVPLFVGAAFTSDLVLENDVMINGMGEGLSAFRCPNAAVRHCVFYNNFIRALTATQFEPGVLITLSHNLVCDSIPKKTYNALNRVSPLSALRADHNVYFARVGPTERHLVETFEIAGKTVGYQSPGQYHGENLLLADVQSLASQEQGSAFGNPGIRAAPELLPSGAPEPQWKAAELHWDGKRRTFAPLDFADFIPAAGNPLARAGDGEPVGLEPKAFSGQE